MGNCQAVDAAALVIQHPSGKLERMYWPITASEVMKTNPGHHVTLIIPLPLSGGPENTASADNSKAVRFTRVKLLRPTDTLVLGRAYRLVTTEEVMKVIRAKKLANIKKNVSESGHLGTSSDKQSASTSESEAGKTEKNDEVISPDNRQRQRSAPSKLGAGRPKSWRPSLQSISESAI